MVPPLWYRVRNVFFKICVSNTLERFTIAYSTWNAQLRITYEKRALKVATTKMQSKINRMVVGGIYHNRSIKIPNLTGWLNMGTIMYALGEEYFMLQRSIRIKYKQSLQLWDVDCYVDGVKNYTSNQIKMNVNPLIRRVNKGPPTCRRDSNAL